MVHHTVARVFSGKRQEIISVLFFIYCAALLLNPESSASHLKGVIILFVNYLQAVTRNWEVTDTSYKTLKWAVNSSVTLPPVLYYLDTFISIPLTPPPKKKGKMTHTTHTKEKKGAGRGTKTPDYIIKCMIFCKGTSVILSARSDGTFWEHKSQKKNYNNLIILPSCSTVYNTPWKQFAFPNIFYSCFTCLISFSPFLQKLSKLPTIIYGLSNENSCSHSLCCCYPALHEIIHQD